MAEEPTFRFILNKPLKGWLKEKRQGGVIRGWQRKWFVLKEHVLYSFNKEDDIKTSNTFLLGDLNLKDIPFNLDEPEKFAFELLSERNGADSVVLSAASKEEKKEWVKALCYHIYAEKGGAIFGMPLQEVMKYDHKHGRAVPRIVEDCIKYLEANAMDVEGIIRLAGRTGLVKELRLQYEMGRQPSLENVDVHTVASLLRVFLRELPESLVPHSIYQQVMNCALRYQTATSNEARTAEVNGLAVLLQEIPDVNYATLAYICRFLSRLATHVGKTKMDENNLACLMGPNLIRHIDSNNPQLELATQDLTQQLTFMLIQHCDVVLPETPSKETVPADSVAMHPVVRRMKDVATGDLLRMSQPLDPRDAGLLRPRAVKDLEGLNFPSQISQEDIFNSGQSPDTPESPFVFVSDYFRSGSAGSASSSETGAAVEGRPIAPRRNRTLKKRRPPSSPGSPDSNRQLDSDDILKALADADAGACAATENSKSNHENRPLASQKRSPDAGYDPRNSFVYLSLEEKSSENDTKLSRSRTLGHNHKRPEKASPDKAEAFASHTDKLGKSALVMDMQMAGLKTELINTKTRSEKQIKELTQQITDMHKKYEVRISSLEKQHKRQILDLNGKLEAERNACAEAVERTVKLQAQLYNYKLRYGELQDGKDQQGGSK